MSHLEFTLQTDATYVSRYLSVFTFFVAAEDKVIILPL